MTDFAELTDPLRPELLALCYRMLGSVHDAEDQVQETLLRAWRGYDRFEGQSSLRTWLYRIATNTCLRALENRSRRPLPTGLGAPSGDPDRPLEAARAEIPWLEPFPDTLLGADPAAVVTSRSSMRLALIAALQYLPPRQRAVLILRDVLSWSAAEVAALLDLSVVAVNSALQRAHARLPADSHSLVQPSEQRQRELLDRYVAAFQNADVDELVAVLTEDAVFEMPPFITWFQGSATIGGFLGPRMRAFGDTPVIRTSANGQPAVALYPATADGQHRLHALQVLTLLSRGVGGIVAFQDIDALRGFELPHVLSIEAT